MIFRRKKSKQEATPEPERQVPSDPMEAALDMGIGGVAIGSPESRERQYGFHQITDGLSNTMLMSESLQATEDTLFDFRGDIFNDDYCAAQFMTKNTPNTGVDRMVCDENYLDNPAPCVNLHNFDTNTASARSNHPGGVNVLFADGSVHFASDAIDLFLWQAQSSMAGDDSEGLECLP